MLIKRTMYIAEKTGQVAWQKGKIYVRKPLLRKTNRLLGWLIYKAQQDSCQKAVAKGNKPGCQGWLIYKAQQNLCQKAIAKENNPVARVDDI